MTLELLFPDSTDSNKRIHSRKKAPKLKYQKLDVHELTGKFYEGKGYVCVVKNIAQGPVMRSFYGVSGVWKQITKLENCVI